MPHIQVSTSILDEPYMQSSVMPRFIAILLAMLSTVLAIAACLKTENGDSSTAYRAACEGQPLRTAEARNKAMEDGYNLNYRYDCIDKASFVAVKEERARWEANNTPEAKAQRAAEWEKKLAEEQARRAARVESQVPVESSTASRQLVRCTSEDGQSSTLKRGQCGPDETLTLVTPTRPLMERSNTSTALIQCTSRDGKKVSIQRGNCASPDDYQQLLGDR